jgi:hypothetical protein
MSSEKVQVKNTIFDTPSGGIKALSAAFLALGKKKAEKRILFSHIMEKKEDVIHVDIPKKLTVSELRSVANAMIEYADSLDKLNSEL